MAVVGATEHVKTGYCSHYDRQLTSTGGVGVTDAPLLRKGVDPMGRGRAKAKQTKVARKLKYQSIGTDLDALQRELSNNPGEPDSSTEEQAHDEYEQYVHAEGEHDDD